MPIRNCARPYVIAATSLLLVSYEFMIRCVIDETLTISPLRTRKGGTVRSRTGTHLVPVRHDGSSVSCGKGGKTAPVEAANGLAKRHAKIEYPLRLPSFRLQFVARFQLLDA
jgi:hypothetical protein